VQRHVKNGWCPDIRKLLKRKREDSEDSDGPVLKRRRLENDFDYKDGYVNLWKRAKAKGEK